MKKLLYILPLILIDQVTKFLSIGQSLTLIPGILLIEYDTNPGIIFGFFSNNLIMTILLPLILIMIFLYLYIKEKFKSRLFNISFILVISGLLGNLIDRLIHNYVIDFIFIPIYPSRNISLFNLADSFLVIGLILLIIYYSKK